MQYVLMQEHWAVGLCEWTEVEEAEMAAHVEQYSKYKVFHIYLGEERTEAIKLQLLDSLCLWTTETVCTF